MQLHPNYERSTTDNYHRAPDSESKHDNRSWFVRIDQDYIKKWLCFEYTPEYHENLMRLDNAIHDENEQMEDMYEKEVKRTKTTVTEKKEE